MRRLFVPLALAVLASARGLPGLGAAAAPPLDVIPTPKKVAPEHGSFEIDKFVAILVSSQASKATRRAARIVQLGLRERLAVDARVIRISEERKLPPHKSIWMIEPLLNRPPERTIGVKGLAFTPPMWKDGYFLRVDMVEIVVHGATAAGSAHGAHTLLQLIRPARRGSLFRRARPPSIPCLWMSDWPTHPVRAVPAPLAVPRQPAAAAALLATLARYKLNALPNAAMPPDPEAARLLREDLTRLNVQLVDAAPQPPDGPLGSLVGRWLGKGPAARYALAALAEQAWTGKAPQLEPFRLRFAREAFGSDEAAEALALTDQCLAASAPGTVTELVARSAAVAAATGDEAERHAAERKAHERRARRLPALWKRIEGPEALRDAFLAVATRQLAAADSLYALADARRLHARGRFSRAARVLRARAATLEPLGEEAGDTRRLVQALARRFEAAAECGKAPALDDLWGVK